jgi:circadian clock protein KaiB
MKTNKASRSPREIASADGREASAPPISRGKTQAFEKSLATRPADKYVLRLFVAGATARSRQAVLRVRQLCEAELKDNYQLEVIDIYQQPNLARDNQIVATPTLVKEFPRPVRRFIGSLLNTTSLFLELDLLTKGKIAL